MLVSLLTEIDGVQELRAGVTVVAGTNRPEVIVSYRARHITYYGIDACIFIRSQLSCGLVVWID
jgi:hypothetical protein